MSVTEPVAHSVQADACVLEYLPTSQFGHTLLALSSLARLVPAAQLLHTLLPLISWYLPGSHGMHESSFVPPWYWPTPQFAHFHSDVLSMY